MRNERVITGRPSIHAFGRASIFPQNSHPARERLGHHVKAVHPAEGVKADCPACKEIKAKWGGE